MKPRKVIAIAAGVALAASLAVAGSAFAVASEKPNPNPNPLKVEANGTTFYSLEGIEANWPEATQAFPEYLPDGVSFPSKPFAFFYTTGEELPLFEEGLTESLLARYWRCAWLDVELRAPSESDVTTQVEDFAALPGVTESLDVIEFAAAVDEVARERGIDPAALEYETECGFYETEGGVR